MQCKHENTGKKSKLLRFLPFLAVVIMVFAFTIPILADTTITFTNERIKEPNLYITKTVQVQEGDTTDYSDTEFTFTLWIDGSVARLVEYTVTNENGEQVYLYEDGESTEVKSNAIAYKTTRQGTFTLKAGQTACFADLGTGTTYKIEEESVDGFTQILPASGEAAEGTVGSYGTSVTFTNLADTDSDESGITVYKTASFPSGWTNAWADTEFSFTITVSGEAYSLETYTVYSQSDNGWLREDYTDSDGNFTLAAGEYAVFTTDANVDYTITENKTSGWRTTTEESYSGSTGDSVQTVVFNNAIASFIVTKEATDTEGISDTDTEFTFILKDGSGNVWPYVTYLLYDIYGNPLYDESGDLIYGETKADGTFTLTGGQAALFYGIASGTAYSVQEVATAEWTQVLPSDPNGYSGKEVSDAVEILPFENEENDLTGTLSVTKTVSAGTSSLPYSNEEFTYYLKDSNGNPVSGAIYSISSGTDTYTYKTGSDGSFTIQAGQTAVFSTLVYGDYTVTEDTSLLMNNGKEWYKFTSVTVTDEEGSETYTIDGQTATVGETGASYAYENTYYVYCSLTVYKYDSDGKTALPGVTYILYGADGKAISEEKTTDTEGKVVWEDLDAGTYTLVETSTLEGYTLLADAVEITLPLVLTTDEVRSGSVDTTNAVYHSADKTWFFYDLTYEITDHAELLVPQTGLSAFFIFAIAGIICAVAVFGISLYQKAKKIQKEGENGCAKETRKDAKN